MVVLKPNLTDYQKDILFSPSRFTVTVASTKAGKKKARAYAKKTGRKVRRK